jgi:hypothetical protein
MDSGFLRRCLEHVEEQRKLQALTTRSSSTHSSTLKKAHSRFHAGKITAVKVPARAAELACKIIF